MESWSRGTVSLGPLHRCRTGLSWPKLRPDVTLSEGFVYISEGRCQEDIKIFVFDVLSRHSSSIILILN